jgi:NAD(P)-dependent dehydrogenase (short-subunit alcohol dehydrogenase family)
MKHAMYEDLHGKNVLITGGYGFLGRALCTQFARQGANLIVMDKVPADRAFLDVLRPQGVKIEFIQVDFESQDSRTDAISKIHSKYSKLDVLINNAAFVGTTAALGWAVPFAEQSIETWRKAIEVNLTTPFHLVQGLFELLEKSDDPVVVNLGSIYGTLGPDWEMYAGTSMGNPAAYAASKGGLIQLTRWLATTLGPKVRVNCVSPGGITRNQDEKFVKKYISRTPLSRMAVEDDVVSAILFLSSASANYITGQNLEVDGGWGSW